MYYMIESLRIKKKFIHSFKCIPLYDCEYNFDCDFECFEQIKKMKKLLFLKPLFWSKS